MTDEEYETWVSDRVAAVRANIEAMTPEKAKAYLLDVAGYIVSETARTEDFDWPANLHLADVLEKHLARGLWDRINELENALSDMAKLFDIENTILVWAFADAPKELRYLSTHGGDEDWLAVLPKSYDSNLPLWMMEGSSFGCCSVSQHNLPDGRTVVIGAHA